LTITYVYTSCYDHFVDGRAEKPVESTNKYEGNGKSFCLFNVVISQKFVELYLDLLENLVF